MVARLSRIIPLLIILAVVAAVIYLVAAWRYSPNRAKFILIRAFTVITGVISGFFVLATAYAAFEQNWTAVEIAASFLAVGLIGLAITLICRWVFLRHHPNYQQEPVPTTTVSSDGLLRAVLQRLLASFLRR
ncbi:MAG: guanylate cyclase [Eggerthellaceae bacterium]|nr:guanylate cyclase [Eggerthellaceae bacterium]